MTALDEKLRSHHPDEAEVDVTQALGRVHSRHRRARRTRIAALAVACVAIIGVGGLAISLRDDPDTGLATGDGEVASIDDLVGIEWRFDRIEFSDERAVIDLGDKETSLQFTDSQLTVRICNTINGDWSSRDSLIVVSQFARTVALCLDNIVAEAEEVFVEVLSDPIAWTATHTTLELSAGPVTAHLSRVSPPPPDGEGVEEASGVQWPFPPEIEPLSDPDVHPTVVETHPDGPQHIIGHWISGGTEEIVIMARSHPDQDFVTVTSASSAILQPVGLTWTQSFVATWLPPDTSTAWVMPASGGVEIGMSMKAVDGAGIAGFTRIPEPSGVIVAFDEAGNEIGRSEPFDIG